MRLADLAAANDSSLSELANAVGVQPLLLQRIDAGRQGMPRSLARLIAERLIVDVTDVLSACPLTTPLEGSVLLHPIPPIAGEPCAPARIVPTGPVVLPTQTGHVLYVFSAYAGSLGDQTSSIVQRFIVGSVGNLTPTTEIDADDQFPDVTAIAVIEGAIGVDRSLWISGTCNNGGIVSLNARVNASDLSTISQGPLTDPVSGAQYTKVLVDPVSGWLWVTISDGFVYRMDPNDMAAGFVALDLTANGQAQLCNALCFPGDGFLYAATYETNTDTQIVQKIDPTPGSASVVQTSATPFASNFGNPLESLMWVEAAGKLYSGYVGGVLAWNMTTLDATFVGDAANKTFNGGTYDAANDEFWFIEQETSTDPQYLLARVPRSTGVATFESPRFQAEFSFAHSPQIGARRLLYVPITVPGNDSPDFNYVQAWTMDGTPTLSAQTLVGIGQEPTGSNRSTASILFA